VNRAVCAVFGDDFRPVPDVADLTSVRENLLVAQPVRGVAVLRFQAVAAKANKLPKPIILPLFKGRNPLYEFIGVNADPLMNCKKIPPDQRSLAE
jgi:hypothetical protein